jgi:hypothetical protein
VANDADHAAAQAATEHLNYVRSQTNDKEQIAQAQANVDRANARISPLGNPLGALTDLANALHPTK